MKHSGMVLVATAALVLSQGVAVAQSHDGGSHYLPDLPDLSDLRSDSRRSVSSVNQPGNKDEAALAGGPDVSAAGNRQSETGSAETAADRKSGAQPDLVMTGGGKGSGSVPYHFHTGGSGYR